jgi:hypothetical protein
LSTLSIFISTEGGDKANRGVSSVNVYKDDREDFSISRNDLSYWVCSELFQVILYVIKGTAEYARIYDLLVEGLYYELETYIDQLIHTHTPPLRARQALISAYEVGIEEGKELARKEVRVALGIDA